MGDSVVELTWEDVSSRVADLQERYPNAGTIYGVPRGGVIPALLMNRRLVDRPEDADLIIDDIIDSGTTRDRFEKYGVPFVALVDKTRHDADLPWVRFPWEAQEGDAEDNVRRLLQAIGEDVSREGLQETPKRAIKMWREFLSPPTFEFTTFASEGYDQMIVQRNISFYSFCEHHMLPFFGTATVAYLPNGKIVGLSKLARCVEHYARRLQNQERITEQVAKRLQDELSPLGVGVTITARHMCMEMRGVRSAGAETTTSCLLGAFRERDVRAEFLNHG